MKIRAGHQNSETQVQTARAGQHHDDLQSEFARAGHGSDVSRGYAARAGVRLTRLFHRHRWQWGGWINSFEFHGWLFVCSCGAVKKWTPPNRRGAK